jgi:hypothetical protein
MLFATVLINADHSSFEDAVIALNSVGIYFVSIAVGVAILAAMMVDRSVLRELFAQFRISIGLTGHDVAFALNILANERQNLVFGRVLDMERTSRAAALNQSKNGVLMPRSLADFEAVFLADEGFINFNGRTFAAHGRKGAVAHCFTDAVSEKPCGFHAPAKSALKLTSANALLGRTKQIDRLKPDVQLDVAGLENSSHADGERLPAGIALIETGAGGLAFERAAIVHNAAMRTNTPKRPEPRLNVGESGLFAMEVIGGKGGLHGDLLLDSNPISCGWECQV